MTISNRTFLVLLLAPVLLVGLVGCENRNDAAPSEAASASEPSAGGEAPANAPGGSEHYRLKSASETIAVDQKSQSGVTIEPTGDLKINEEFPWKIEFAPSDGVELAQGAFEKSDLELSEKAAEIPLLLEVDEAGEHTLEASGDFSVCTDSECFVMRDESLTFEIDAEEGDTEDASE
ncbi:MAG: hypothetical protein ACOCV2_12170 [Persicimonas sp.]